jgi:hypothetical protein
MKTIDIHTFAETMKPHAKESYSLEICGWQVAIIHGLIALAASHPSVKNMNQTTQITIKTVRTMCLEIKRTWGLDQESLDYLDRSHEQTEASNEP